MLEHRGDTVTRQQSCKIKSVLLCPRSAAGLRIPSGSCGPEVTQRWPLSPHQHRHTQPGPEHLHNLRSKVLGGFKYFSISIKIFFCCLQIFFCCLYLLCPCVLPVLAGCWMVGVWVDTRHVAGERWRHHIRGRASAAFLVSVRHQEEGCRSFLSSCVIMSSHPSIPAHPAYTAPLSLPRRRRLGAARLRV